MKRKSLIPAIIWLCGLIPAASQNVFETYASVREMETNSVFRGIPWKQVGPVFQGGRVESLDSPVDQPQIIYAGFGSGNLWKTTDHGLSWKCIFPDQATFSIGDVCLAPSNPDIIYLGTGEGLRASRGFTYPGTGVYKSVDGGQTWASAGLHDSQHIGRIAVDPNNPDLVFVAAMGRFWTPGGERGLYISADGGRSWKRSLFISDSVGVADVVWDPVNKVILASAWQMIAGKQGGLYRSADMGAHWEKCTDGFPSNDGTGRIGLAVSLSNPKVMYACLDNRNPQSILKGSEIIGLEVYRSDNSGKTWKKTHSGLLDNYSGFGWAFGDIRISPVDENEIFVLGVHVIRSSDGGKNFSRVGGRISHLTPSRATTLHLDHHDLLIDPRNPDRLVLGNDGGIYISQDDGGSWLHCNTLPVAEFYDLVVDRSHSMGIYGGTQDNSGIYSTLNHGVPVNGRETWDYVWLDPWSGGDGFITLPDPTDSDVIYYSSQNGYLNRKNRITGETVFIQPKSDSDESPLRTSWLTPYFVSVHAPATLYYGANKVYKSVDRGDNWYRLSPDLCFPEDPLRKSRALTALAESPTVAGLLYAATEKGAVWVSRNDGVQWFEISKGLPVKGVVQVCPSRHAESRVYLVMRAGDEDDYTPYLFVSENKGSGWKSISEGLPSDRITCILEDPSMPDLIYIGTDRAAYISPDRGKHWVSISRGLTTAGIQKLVWDSGNDYLIAACHGMGLYSCFAAPIRKYFKAVDPKKECLLAVQAGYLPGQKDFPGDIDWSRSMPLGVYWYQPKEGQMSVTVSDSENKEIFSMKFQATLGINHWDWNLVTGSREDTGLYPVHEYKFPAPGTYEVVIQGQGIVVRTPIEVR